MQKRASPSRTGHELTLVRRPLTTLVFVAKITGEFILGLTVLRVRAASVDLRSSVLRLGDEEVALLRPGLRPRSSPLHEEKQRSGSDSVW
jgi:hypothetical protein